DRLYDYCVIRLNRRTDRKPYKFRTGGAVTFDDMVAMIGSPSGLPLKVADSAHVTNNEDYTTSFLTDLDAFHGNSGGPVFNLYGFIEGILVRGPGNDYHVDEESGTIKQDSRYDLYYYFGLQAETGNGVHRITHIPWNLLVTSVYRNIEVAAMDNNLDEFKEWIIYTWIWKKENELPGKENILAQVAKYGREDMLNEVIGTPAVNVNTKDMYGSYLVHILAEKNLASSIAKAAAVEGFDINARNSYNETALMVAARNGSLAAVNALISAGANVKATNSAGKTARSLAKSAKQKEIAKILKKAEKASK
ncbi:MAG: ankyrin repeat domain-containing protein, partial [Bacteroidia bacterium]|nr:ankyrin repeat domain-containing protein [Bacteroidia bacterium]